MLFILAMDPLQRILHRATQAGALNPIGADPITLRTSLYADDAALFVRPTATDVGNVCRILEVFGEATGLKTNIQKSELYQIRCSEIEVSTVTAEFQGQLCSFPCKYLGFTHWED